MIIGYWRMLLKSAVLRGHTLKECLGVIRKDVVAVWNFNDPDEVYFSPLASSTGADDVLNAS